jgi:hypothetical protein
MGDGLGGWIGGDFVGLRCGVYVLRGLSLTCRIVPHEFHYKHGQAFKGTHVVDGKSLVL